MKENCKHYTLDCQAEKMGCEGCGYYKPLAKTDRAYCVKENCETKEECDRHIEHYKFDENKQYEFIAECEEYQGWK